ncbi:MAG: hypothetical protein N2170_05600 [Bacteroidia bacterium]|nr:hypothetical protein [Bacteroidia bacterium]
MCRYGVGILLVLMGGLSVGVASDQGRWNASFLQTSTDLSHPAQLTHLKWFRRTGKGLLLGVGIGLGIVFGAVLIGWLLGGPEGALLALLLVVLLLSLIGIAFLRFAIGSRRRRRGPPMGVPGPPPGRPIGPPPGRPGPPRPSIPGPSPRTPSGQTTPPPPRGKGRPRPQL